MNESTLTIVNVMCECKGTFPVTVSKHGTTSVITTCPNCKKKVSIEYKKGPENESSYKVQFSNS